MDKEDDLELFGRVFLVEFFFVAKVRAIGIEGGDEGKWRTMGDMAYYDMIIILGRFVLNRLRSTMILHIGYTTRKPT